MNITHEKTDDLSAIITLEIEEADYNVHYDKELKKYRKQAVFPGFRPGKAPLSLIKKKFGDSVLADLIKELNKIIQDALNDYIIKEKLELLGSPIENTEKGMPDFVNEKEFKFYFDIGLAPEIKLELNNEIVAEYFKIKVEDAVIDQSIEDVRKRKGEYENTERVEENSKIDVKFQELDDEGQPKEGGLSGTSTILLSYIKDEDIEKQIIGKKVGDTIVFNPMKATGNVIETSTILNIKEEEAEKFKNDVVFTIKGISHLVPAIIDKELFEFVFPDKKIDDEKDFRENVKNDILLSYKYETDNFFVTKTIDMLIEKADFNLPDDFLKKYLFTINEGKISKDDIENNYSKYSNGIKHQLIKEKLIKDFPNLQIFDEDIKNNIKNRLSKYTAKQNEEGSYDNQSLEKFAEKYMKNKKDTQKIYDQLYKERLLTLLKSKLTLEEKEITPDEFIQLSSVKTLEDEPVKMNENNK